LLAREFAYDVLGRDSRLREPSLEDIRATKLDEVKALLAPILASASLDVVITGDVESDAAIDAVARTLGALPARNAGTSLLTSFDPVHYSMPTPTPIVIHHHGRADQGVAAIAWPTTDGFHRKDWAALSLLSQIFSTRLLDRLRINEGVTYSPDVSSFMSNNVPGQGYLYAKTELPPAKMPLFFDAVRAIAADLRAHPVTADELERARKPGLEGLVAAKESNLGWAVTLIGTQADPRRLDLARDAIPVFEAVTPADIQDAAGRYLVDDKAWKFKVTPDPQGLAPAG
jgi:zinc protease